MSKRAIDLLLRAMEARSMSLQTSALHQISRSATDALTAAKLLVLKSARDFCALFESIPNPDISPRAPRTSFYGPVPRTPREMYDHTNSTTAYYMAAFGIPFENMPDLYANRLQALAEIEEREELLTGKVCTAPDGERWTLRKLLRPLHQAGKFCGLFGNFASVHSGSPWG